MIIIRYSLNDSLDQISEIYSNLRLNFKDEKVICLPQDWDILFNGCTADLYYFKEMIENAIHDKEVAEG